MLVLPTSTVPARFSRSTTCASYGATKFASIREPQVVRRPCGHKTSLCAIGMPVSAAASPRASAASAARAPASAPSAVDGDERVERAAVRPRCARAAGCVSSTLESASRGAAPSATSSATVARGVVAPFASTRSPSARGRARPRPRARRLEERAPVGLGDAVLAQRRASRPARAPSARRRSCRSPAARRSCRRSRRASRARRAASRGVDLDAGEMGDAVDVVEGEGHAVGCGARNVPVPQRAVATGDGNARSAESARISALNQCGSRAS